MALSEWNLTPQYVNEEWTPEILWLMFHERVLEIDKRNELMKAPTERTDDGGERRFVSDAELFKIMGINPKGHA